jgi:hypothetical protein
MEERRSELPATPAAPVPKTDPPPMKDVSYRGDLCWLGSPTWDRDHDIAWVSCDYAQPDKGDMPSLKYTRLSAPNT